MRSLYGRGVALRIALASLAVALLALGIITIAVLQVARGSFEHLMMSHGSTQADATRMFQQTVGVVFTGAVAAAAVASAVLAAVFARYLARPLEAMARAARRLAQGDYSVRVPSHGPQEVRAAAESFNQMANSLEEQERARRDFIAGAAHELLTPLTNLQGYLEGLRDGVIPADAAMFASLHEETERLVRLSRSLLTLAEAATGPTPPIATDIDLVRVVAASVELSQPTFARRRIKTELNLPRRLMAHANPDHATQILFNLLQNAARYADEGGQVWITGTRRNGQARVEVANTGPAIPAEEVPRLFERFYRLDQARGPSTGGHGLGLALVKQLVQNAGGEVGAAARDGVTHFWFTLPGASPQATARPRS